jgi:GDPmannose 4,6-dehydratase
VAKTAIITGVTGQDGVYLSKLLLDNGYAVYGTYRKNTKPDLWRLEDLGIVKDIKLLSLDLTDYSDITDILISVEPDEFYNLAAQSSVGESFEIPMHTCEVGALGVLNIVEAIRTINPGVKFYQASTSELYGMVKESPQTEKTPFHPRSPYSVAKSFAHYITQNYREAYDLHASSGILFNHESPYRGENFVTRKITIGLAKIVNNQQEILELGNINARRDWGHAKDYVKAMYMMLQQEKPDDYIVASGISFSIKEFINIAANTLDIELEWTGEGLAEHAVDKSTGDTIIRINEKLFRPSDVDSVQGDARKALEILGWKPTVDFKNLVREMALVDLDRIVRGKI